ncbi:hypothetical protein P9112_010430 [Eukaryota sp. TZLM1-RC]
MDPSKPPPPRRLPSLSLQRNSNTTLGGAPKKSFVPFAPPRPRSSGEPSVSGAIPGLLKSIERKLERKQDVKPTAPKVKRQKPQMQMGATFFSAKANDASVPFAFSPVDELKPELLNNYAERELVFEENYQPAELPFLPPPEPLPSDPQEKPVYHLAPRCGVLFEKAAEDWKNTNGLFMLQLPSSLPFLPSKDPFAAKKGQPTTPVQSRRKKVASDREVAEAKSSGKRPPKPFEPFPSNCGHLFDSSLSNVTPGYCGKLKVFKSGKVKLVFENGLALDVCKSVGPSFDERVVSITAKQNLEAAQLESSTLVDLGGIGSRFTGVLDFD